MKISTKILLGFGVLIVLVWIIGIFSIASFSRSSALFNQMDSETIPALTTVGEMGQKVAEAHVDFMEFLLSGKVSARDKVVGIMRTLETLAQGHLNRIEAEKAEEKTTADDLVKKIRFFSSSAVDVMDMKARGISDEELLSAEEKTVRPIFDSIMSIIAKQNDIYKSEMTVMREDVKASQDRGLLIIVIIAIVAMITGLVLAFIYGKRISLPIVNLTRAADDISKGEISKPVVKETTDEIGELAEAFERMRVSLKVMIEEESE